MIVKAQRIGEVQGLGDIYEVAAPLPEQLQSFDAEGIPAPFLALPEEIARIRLKGLPTNWSRTSVTPVIAKGEPLVLYKPTQILPAHLMNVAHARKAIGAHRSNTLPVFDRDVYDAARELAEADKLRQPEDRMAQIFESEDRRVGVQDDEIRFLLSGQASPYFAKFVPNGSIPFWGIPQSNIGKLDKDECIVNYGWFGGPRSGSSFSCRGGGLSGDDGAFAVLRKTRQ